MPTRFLSRPRADTVQILGYLDAMRARALLKAEVKPMPSPRTTPQVDVHDDGDTPLSKWFEVRLFDPVEVRRTLALFDGKEQRAARVFLSDLSQLPSVRTLRPPPSVSAVRDLGKRFPNFGAVVDLVETLTVLARAKPGSPLILPPLLLAGPPGVGKTAFAVALAETLVVEWSLLGMSHATAGFDLGGLDSGYGRGGPGLLTRQVALGQYPDRVVILDELDKTPTYSTSDPLGPLYELLEPSTARRFMDDGVKVAIDLSHIHWIGTANAVDQLDAALKSRFRIFHIDPPTAQQAEVITQAIYAALLDAHAWGFRFTPNLPPDVVQALAAYSPREVRAVLVVACGRAVKAGRSHLRLEDLDPPPRPPRRIGFV